MKSAQCAHCGEQISLNVGFASIRSITATGIKWLPLCNPPGGNSCYAKVVLYGHELGLPKTDAIAAVLQDHQLDLLIEGILYAIPERAE